MGVRSWLLGLLGPTRGGRHMDLPHRAERMLAAKARRHQDGAPLWSEADRHVRTRRTVPVGYGTSLVRDVTVVDVDDETEPEPRRGR